MQKGSEELLRSLKENLQKISKFKVELLTEKSNYPLNTYHSSVSGKVLTVRSSSLTGHLYALSHLIFALGANSLPNCLGIFYPKYTNSAVWFSSTTSIPSQPYLSLPEWLDEESVPSLAKMLYRCGFNRVIFGEWEGGRDVIPDEKGRDPKKILSLLESYGIQVSIKPSLPEGSPSDPAYNQMLLDTINPLISLLPATGSIFWEQNPYRPEFQESESNFLLYDLVVKELHLLENILKPKGIPLTYSVSTLNSDSVRQQKEWLSRFTDDLGQHTTLAFSALEGAPWEEHRPRHPYWNQLRQESIPSTTPIQPIVNTGAIKQGEALWPSVACSDIDHTFARMQRHSFYGPVVLAPTIPKEGSFLEANLWTMGQGIWHSGSASDRLEQWCRYRLPEEDSNRVVETIGQVRQIVVELSHLMALPPRGNQAEIGSSLNETCRFQADSLIARLNHLRAEWKFTEKSESKTPFQTSLRYFLRDAKRMVFHFLQTNNFSVANVLTGEDLLEGYWTKMDSQPGKGIGAGGKVTLRF